LRAGASERGAGVSLIFTIVLLVIAVRQTLLDLFPRPGHDYIGSAVFGIHMPVWSVFIAVALLAGFALRFALFGSPRLAAREESAAIRGAARALGAYVALLCAINFVSVILQCGLGECHTFGYSLLPA
jgi:ribose/xylose/arabinose/galactoside ABC-type transport system permease subunit